MSKKPKNMNPLAEDEHQSMAPKQANITSPTLQRDIDESEGRIVLRKIDESGLCSPSSSSSNLNTNRRILSGLPIKISSIKKSATESGNHSVSTTTSDVSSDDDATSIVSRLSKIVVEQEEMLNTESKQLSSSPSQQPNQQQTTLIRSGSSNLVGQTGTTNSNSNNNGNLRPNMSKRRSLVADRSISNDRLENSISVSQTSSEKMCHRHSIKPQLNNDDNDKCSIGKIDEDKDDIDQCIANRSNTRFPSTPNLHLPEIHLINDNNNKYDGRDVVKSGNLREKSKKGRAKSEQKDKYKRKARAKSVVEAILGEKQQVFMRRNEFSGYLPERGDLRNLENSKFNLTNNQAKNVNGKISEENDLSLNDIGQQVSTNNEIAKTQTRLRSNTTGSVDRSILFGNNSNSETDFSQDESMLHIRRSAWTLSEFDKTYNGSSASLNHHLTSNNSSTELDDIRQQVILAKSGSEKLLLKASRNVISKNHQFLAQASNRSSVNNSKQSTTNYNKKDNRLSSLTDTTAKDIEPSNFTNIEYARRPSQTNSISSLNSSCSFNKVFRTGFSWLPDFQNKSMNEESSSNNGKNNDSSSRLNILPELGRYIPIIEWITNYKFSLFWGDLTAGIAVAVLNISTSLSSALVAGTDFGVAFRASIVNTFIYAIFCSSKHTSFGSWSIMSQMLLVSVTRALSDELILSRLNMGPTASWEPEEYERWHLNIIIMYTFLIGLIQLVCGLLKLGNILASFIPEALCSSLITATAFTMAVGQLANMGGTSNRILFSIEKNTTELWADLKNPPVDITDLFSGLFRWIKQIALLFKYHEQINFVCIIISLVSVVLLFLNQYVFQKQLKCLCKRKILLPSEMILLVIMIIVSNLFGLKENYQVTTCGPINIDFVVPDVPNLKLIRELWFESVATALISYTMVYVMAKTYGNKFNYDVDFNQELIACGAGNLVGGLFDSLPATASFSRTAGQVEAGGRTQMASIINCIVLVILAQIFGKYVAELPVCVMAATLFFGFARMMSRFSEVFKYWRVCKVDFAIWMVTFLAILTSDIVNGFVYGFIFSILTMLYRAQK